MVKGLENHIKKPGLHLEDRRSLRRVLSHRRAEDRRQLGCGRGRNAGKEAVTEH